MAVSYGFIRTSNGLDALTISYGDRPVLRSERVVHVEVDGVEHATAGNAGAADISWSVHPRGSGGVWELMVTVTNRGEAPVRVSRADPLRVVLTSADWEVLHFTSAWGKEFEPVRSALSGPLRLRGQSGRSSHGLSPWLGLQCAHAGVVVSPAWSGNWHIDLDADRELTAGISPVDFGTVLAPGEMFTAPSVFLAVAPTVDAAAALLAAAVASDVLPAAPAEDKLPVEWNHWWPYEDDEITEEVFLANAHRAADLGVEVCTLDAGWFGRVALDSDWQHERGDWELENTRRFPRGLADLGHRVRAAGTDFGVWIEAEAAGAGSRLRAERPEIIATRSQPPGERHDYRTSTVSLDEHDPTFLGYVCLGSPGGREYVQRSMDALVRKTGARWVKLDFNIDPGAGCDRTDHGHGRDDGLYAHYEGLYAVLDEFREAHPDVLLEACASGGLRVDLGLARHVHCFFLSDPDWTEHHLQVLWGAALLLPPRAILHWSWSQWRTSNPNQVRDFAALSTAEFDTMLRAAMLHRFGVSLKLPELPEHLAERLRVHIDAYRSALAPLVRHGSLRRCSAQPLRHGRGERVPVFQLDAPTGHLLAAFVLPRGHRPRVLRFAGLPATTTFRIRQPTESAAEPLVATGAQLMTDGVEIPDGPQTSWLLLAEPQG